MRYLAIFAVSIVLAVLVWKGFEPGAYLRKLSEDTEVYFDPTDEATGVYGSEEVRIRLRQAGVEFAVAKNSLVEIYHPYQPWVKKFGMDSLTWLFGPSLREEIRKILKTLDLQKILK